MLFQAPHEFFDTAGESCIVVSTLWHDDCSRSCCTARWLQGDILRGGDGDDQPIGDGGSTNRYQGEAGNDIIFGRVRLGVLNIVKVLSEDFPLREVVA